MNQQYDILITGGGVLGLFHAYHAIEKGYSVALLDRSSTPNGSSVQNFGQIVPSGMNFKWQEYGRTSLEIYKSIHQKLDISLRQNGSIYIASDNDELLLLEELAQINRDNNYSSQLLTSKECIARYEGLSSNYCKGGLFFPDEITLEPRIAIPRILEFLIKEKNLHYFRNTLVRDIYTSNRKCIVETSFNRVFNASKVLVCGGYEFQLLFPEIFYQSDLQIVKLQMLRLGEQPTQKIPGSILTGRSIRRYESFKECPSYDAVAHRAAQDNLATDWGLHILFKQAADGSVILGDSHEYADARHADALAQGINYELNEQMLTEAQKIFQLQNWSVKETWAGYYAQCKQSDIFHHIIDGRIHLLTGIGGKGMTGSAGFSKNNINNIDL